MTSLEHPVAKPFHDGLRTWPFWEYVNSETVLISGVVGSLSILPPLLELIPPPLLYGLAVTAVAGHASIGAAALRTHARWIAKQRSEDVASGPWLAPTLGAFCLPSLLAVLWLSARASTWLALGLCVLLVALAHVAVPARLHIKQAYLLYRFYPDDEPGCWSISPTKSERERMLYALYLVTVTLCSLVGAAASVWAGIAFGLLTPFILAGSYLPAALLLRRKGFSVTA